MRLTCVLVSSAFATMLSGCEAKNNDHDAGDVTSEATPIGAATNLSVVSPFPDASEVRLFVETDTRLNGPRVFTEPKGRLLTNDQRKAFEATLKIEPIPDVLAACFVPHHFFAYYDAKGKKLGQISVCFCCSGAGADGPSGIKMRKDQWLSADFDKLKGFVGSLNLPTDVQCR